MNNELYNKRQKRKKNMYGKNLGHIFVIGVIYKELDTTKVEAFKVYDIRTKKTEIQSVETIKNRLESGERILGIHVNYSLKYKKGIEEYKLTPRIVYDSGAYNIRNTDILNGKGEVIAYRKSVIIGVEEHALHDIFIIMNGNGEIDYVSEEEAIKSNLNGVINNKYICLNSCQQVIV